MTEWNAKWQGLTGWVTEVIARAERGILTTNKTKPPHVAESSGILC